MSALLNWPIASFASSITKIGDSEFEVIKEVDTGLQKGRLPIPCVISCDLRLNTPRICKLPNITAAKKKPIKEIKLEDLKIDVAPRVKLVEMSDPPVRKGGVKVKDVDELLHKLTNEAKLL